MYINKPVLGNAAYRQHTFDWNLLIEFSLSMFHLCNWNSPDRRTDRQTCSSHLLVAKHTIIENHWYTIGVYMYCNTASAYEVEDTNKAIQTQMSALSQRAHTQYEFSRLEACGVTASIYWIFICHIFRCFKFALESNL